MRQCDKVTSVYRLAWEVAFWWLESHGRSGLLLRNTGGRIQTMNFNFVPGVRGRLLLMVVTVFVVLGGLIVRQSLERRDEQLQHVSGELLQQARLVAGRQNYLAARAETLLADLRRNGCPCGVAPMVCPSVCGLI